MKLVTRAQWGAKAPHEDLAYIAGTRGTKIHWEGTPVAASLAKADGHTRCDDRVRAIQAAHMANTKEDYSDIAYNFVVCPHGSVYEGRGLHRRTGANGNRGLNEEHYAVLSMTGPAGDGPAGNWLTKPTAAMLVGLADAVDYLHAKGGAGSEVKGHQDGYATKCPGPALEAWVKAGGGRPDVEDDDDVPAAPAFPGRQYFVKGARNRFALQLQKWLDKGDWGPAYVEGPSQTMTTKDLQKVAALQRHYLSNLGPADGLTGPLTWRYAYEVAAGLRKR